MPSAAKVKTWAVMMPTVIPTYIERQGALAREH